MSKNYFEELAKVSIKDKVEKKGNFDYLSWANAWALIKLKYPNAQRNVYEDQATGLNFFTDGRTAYVKVGIVINDLEHIDYLPIMDFRNNSIRLKRLHLWMLILQSKVNCKSSCNAWAWIIFVGW